MTCVNTARARRLASGIALLTIAVSAPVEGARATDLFDDFTTLRGSVSGGRVRWDGFQLGGHIGYVNSKTDFGHATRETVESIENVTTLANEDPPSEWQVLGKGSQTGRSFGGYIGYNWELDSVVVGIDATYNYTDGITTRGRGSLGPGRIVTTSDGNTWTVDIRGRSSLTMHDYATLRARVGYPMGQFLPYAFLGGAVGRFDYRTRTIGSVTSGATIAFDRTQAKESAVSPGLTTGLGVDIAILPNMYLRAEYEFNAFLELAGITPITHTGKVGVGFRF